VKNDDKADWRNAWALFPGNVVYAWSPGGDLLVEHRDALIAAGFEVRAQIIWAKQQFVIGRGNYHVQHEPCWYSVRKGATAHWQGDRTQSTLWQIDKPVKSETGHSTQKPVECMKRPIENNSQPGDGVYDPFVGSGTTIVAAEMTARRCYAIEIDPGYVDCSIERWQNFTGKQATMDGQSFDQVRAERLGKKPKSSKFKAKAKAKAPAPVFAA
jgi:DNA modification methylase